MDSPGWARVARRGHTAKAHENVGYRDSQRHEMTPILDELVDEVHEAGSRRAGIAEVPMQCAAPVT